MSSTNENRDHVTVKVAAVVVTYNRKELLSQCLDGLLRQTRPLDLIIIIDNASTDGTREFLKKAGDMHPGIVQCIRNTEDLGASAGFHEGMKLAYEKGYDWIWMMDDDAYPYEDALQHLVSHTEKRSNDESFNVCLYSAYISADETRFSEPITVFVNGQKCTYLHFDEILKSRVFEGEGGPFLGLLIPRQAIATVGLPRKDTFIWGDYEYILRLRDAGFKIYYNFASKIRHPSHAFKSVLLPIGIVKLKPPIWRPFRVLLGPPWKQYYGMRNSVFFRTRSGISVLSRVKRILSTVLRICILVSYGKENRLEMIRYCLKGIVDGLRGEMGIIIGPYSTKKEASRNASSLRK